MSLPKYSFEPLPIRANRKSSVLADLRDQCEEAGCGCFERKCFNRRWVICFRISGQAYKRETAAESMTKALAAMGYDALTYCAMD